MNLLKTTKYMILKLISMIVNKYNNKIQRIHINELTKDGEITPS
jgi:hypothetical protein